MPPTGGDGIVSAVRPDSLFGHIATASAFVGHSLPTCFAGLLFILFFSLHLGRFPCTSSTRIEA
jgi:ABC-type dipeptide/oligopeptide/nickel transport system permease component